MPAIGAGDGIASVDPATSIPGGKCNLGTPNGDLLGLWCIDMGTDRDGTSPGSRIMFVMLSLLLAMFLYASMAVAVFRVDDVGALGSVLMLLRTTTYACAFAADTVGDDGAGRDAASISRPLLLLLNGDARRANDWLRMLGLACGDGTAGAAGWRERGMSTDKDCAC